MGWLMVGWNCRGGQLAAARLPWWSSQRGMSTGSEDSGEEVSRVKQLAEEIMHLNLLEIADLTEILQKRLGIDGMSQMQMGQPMGGELTLPPKFHPSISLGVIVEFASLLTISSAQFNQMSLLHSVLFKSSFVGPMSKIFISFCMRWHLHFRLPQPEHHSYVIPSRHQPILHN